MEHVLLKLILGHIIGDFFFQFSFMANNKNKTGIKGFIFCSTHVLVYTLFVACIVGNFSPVFLLAVAIPHWLVDRYSLAYTWMKFTGSAPLMTSINPKDASFGVIIYVVIDQTIHLVSLCLAIQLT